MPVSLRADSAAALKALDAPMPASASICSTARMRPGSEALSARFGKAMGAGAERIDLDGPTSAQRSGAAGRTKRPSISMFGDKRWIRVPPAGDESTAADRSPCSTVHCERAIRSC